MGEGRRSFGGGESHVTRGAAELQERGLAELELDSGRRSSIAASGSQSPGDRQGEAALGDPSLLGRTDEASRLGG